MKKETAPLFNSKRRMVFVCLGGQVQASHLELLLTENNIGYSTVTEYYQMDLTMYNTVIMSRPDSIKHFQENKHCYSGLQIYLVNPKGSTNRKYPQINRNIQFIEHEDTLILDLVKGVRP